MSGQRLLCCGQRVQDSGSRLDPVRRAFVGIGHVNRHDLGGTDVLGKDRLQHSRADGVAASRLSQRYLGQELGNVASASALPLRPHQAERPGVVQIRSQGVHPKSFSSSTGSDSIGGLPPARRNVARSRPHPEPPWFRPHHRQLLGGTDDADVSLELPRSGIDRHVNVVIVVGGDAATIGHPGPAALPVDPDALTPNQVLDVQGVRVGLQECGHLVA